MLKNVSQLGEGEREGVMGGQENLQSLRRCSRIVVLLCILDNVLDLYRCDVKYFFLFFIPNAFLSPSQGKDFVSREREMSKRICDGRRRGKRGDR